MHLDLTPHSSECSCSHTHTHCLLWAGRNGLPSTPDNLHLGCTPVTIFFPLRVQLCSKKQKKQKKKEIFFTVGSCHPSHNFPPYSHTDLSLAAPTPRHNIATYYSNQNSQQCRHILHKNTPWAEHNRLCVSMLPTLTLRFTYVVRMNLLYTLFSPQVAYESVLSVISHVGIGLYALIKI